MEHNTQDKQMVVEIVAALINTGGLKEGYAVLVETAYDIMDHINEQAKSRLK